MPVSTRGKLRNTPTAVPVTGSLWFGFGAKDFNSIAGISEGDMTALGHKAPNTAGTGVAVVYGCNAPKPARFSKRLTGAETVQKSVSSFGDGTSAAAINAAAAKGWRIIKPIRLASVAGGEKMRGVLVLLSNGIYVVCNIPRAEATQENATLFGWELTPGSARLAKTVRACSTLKPAKVKKANGAGGTITYPCRVTKLDAAIAAGWTKAQDELIGTGSVAADAE